MYYRTYFSASYLILVLRSLSLSYGSSTCTTEFILVFRILSLYYGAYTCIMDFIRVLHNLIYFTDTRVPVGTTELTQIQEYP